MIVDMRFVRMGANEKSVITLQETFRKFIADTVRFLRRNLSRLEGLPYLIRNNVVFLYPARQLPVLTLGKRKFGNHGLRLAGKRRNQLTAVGLVRVHPVFRPISQALCQRFPFVQVHGDNSCCRHIAS